MRAAERRYLASRLGNYPDPINYDLLAAFQRENAAWLDRLLSQTITGLVAEKLISLEELAIDGTKSLPLAKAGVRACAGRGSMSKRQRLEKIEKAVAERVAALKSELEQDPAEPERRRKQRALQAAEERARRVERAEPNDFLPSLSTKSLAADIQHCSCMQPRL
jgi:hypothetical protein